MSAITARGRPPAVRKLSWPGKPVPQDIIDDQTVMQEAFQKAIDGALKALSSTAAVQVRAAAAAAALNVALEDAAAKDVWPGRPRTRYYSDPDEASDAFRAMLRRGRVS